jgi:hypothetical protein
MSATLLIVLTALTAARLTRLLVADAFPPLLAARTRVVDRWGDESWQAYLAHCPWCTGVYVAGLLTWAVTAIYGLPAPLLVWGASAFVAGYLPATEPGADA